MKHKCIQCEKEVEVWEDATILHGLAWNEPFTSLMYQTKCIRCSPSRAQHIVHASFEPVADERPQFDKRLWSDPESPVYKKHGPNFATECETRYTEAWLQMQMRKKDKKRKEGSVGP